MGRNTEILHEIREELEWILRPETASGPGRMSTSLTSRLGGSIEYEVKEGVHVGIASEELEINSDFVVYVSVIVPRSGDDIESSPDLPRCLGDISYLEDLSEELTKLIQNSYNTDASPNFTKMEFDEGSSGVAYYVLPVDV